MSILGDKVKRVIDEEIARKISINNNKIEKLQIEVNRLKRCCEKHNSNPENVGHKIGYKKPAMKPARKLRPEEYFDKWVSQDSDNVWCVKYKQNLIMENTRDKCYNKFINEWYKNN